MKLFIITSRIPFPLDKGDKLRIYHQMKSLAKDHDIYLCALKLPFSKQNPAAYQELKSFCKEVFILKLSALQILLSLAKALATKTPFQTALFTTKKAKKTVNNLVYGFWLLSVFYIFCSSCKLAINVLRLYCLY